MNLDQGSPSTLGGRHWEELRQNCERSNLERNAYAKRKMGKIEKEKMWSHSTKSRNVQRKEKCWEVQKKKSSKEKIWRKIKIKIKILHMTINDPWSDHPKTRFWAYLSSSCINLNLAYITYFEVHLDQMQVLELKSFSSLRK